MKKLFLGLIIFLLPTISWGQHVSAEIFSRTTNVALDSTDTKKVYIYFYAPRAPRTGLVGSYVYPQKLQVAESTEHLNPPDGQFNDGNLLVFLYGDSVDAGDTDSLVTYGFRIDPNGKEFGDTLDLDWNTDHAVEQATTSWDNMLDWEKQSAQADTNRCYYWIDFTGEYEACHGIVLYFIQYAVGPTDEFRSNWRLFTAEVR